MSLNLFSFFTGFMCGLALTVTLNTCVGFHRKQPVQPTIQVECTGGVCDTTYVYKF